MMTMMTTLTTMTAVTMVKTIACLCRCLGKCSLVVCKNPGADLRCFHGFGKVAVGMSQNGLSVVEPEIFLICKSISQT